MRRQRGSRLPHCLLTALVMTGLAAENAQATTPCTASGIMAVEPACPNDPAQPCQIRSKIEAPPGGSCDLDFGGRDLVIGSAVGPPGSIRAYDRIDIRAKSFTMHPNGSINGRGEPSMPDGADLYAQVTGAVTLLRAGAQMATIDVAGAAGEYGGRIEIDAGGTVTIDGVVRGGKQVNAPDETSAGEISIRSGSDIVGSGRLLDPSGIYSDQRDAVVALDAEGRVDFAGEIDISGYAGSLYVRATEGVRLHDVAGAGDGIPSFGGIVEIDSAGDVLITGDLNLRAIGPSNGDQSGYGGYLRIGAQGSIAITGEVRADATGVDGSAGGTELNAATDILLESGGLLSAAAGNNEGYGGSHDLTAGRDAVLRGDVDLTARAMGGELEVTAGRHVTLDGSIDAGTPAVSDEASGGEASFKAGTSGTGHLVVHGQIDVNGGGCLYGTTYGGGGLIDFSGCDLIVAPGARVRACGRSGGYISLTARRQLTIGGEIDAPNVGLPGDDGTITLTHAPGFPPQVAMATFAPQPALVSQPECSGGAPMPCLMPCPECGDGVVDFPETCDTQGTPESCDGCSLFCRSEEPGCDDGRSCTTDSCHPVLSCRHDRLYSCYECQGDVDDDGAVDADDFAAVAYIINHCAGVALGCPIPGAPYAADFDYDGHLTAADLTRMIANRLDPSLPAGCVP